MAKRASTAWAATIALAACAHTDTGSFRDPAATAKCTRIVVTADMSDLEHRQLAEKEFVKELRDKGVDAIPSTTIWLPTRDYSADELVRAVEASGADAVLTLQVTDAYHTQSYVPPSTTSQGQANWIGNTLYFSGSSRTFGGFYVRRPVIHLNITLFEVASGKRAWITTTKSRGNGFSDFDDLMEDAAEETVDRMIDDKVILRGMSLK